MNQDSDDHLTKRQRTERSKVLEDNSDADKTEFDAVKDYFKDAIYEAGDVRMLFLTNK